MASFPPHDTVEKPSPPYLESLGRFMVKRVKKPARKPTINNQVRPDLGPDMRPAAGREWISFGRAALSKQSDVCSGASLVLFTGARDLKKMNENPKEQQRMRCPMCMELRKSNLLVCLLLLVFGGKKKSGGKIHLCGRTLRYPGGIQCLQLGIVHRKLCIRLNVKRQYPYPAV